MKRLKRIRKKVLFPGLAAVMICVALTIVLLGYVFSGHEDSPLAYVVYLFSAYTLVITCTWVGSKASGTKKHLDEKVVKNIPLLDRFLNEPTFQVHVMLYLTLGVNLLYAAIKLISGLYYHSIWFGTLSAYYSILALMRFLLLRKTTWGDYGKDMCVEWKKYRLCGWLLLVMNLSLSGVVVLVVWKNEGFQYAGYLIYLMALFTIYLAVTAVWNMFRFRKYNSPVMAAARVISLVAAMVSILSLETAMLARFPNEARPERFRQLMTGITGAGVCLTILALAIFMIWRATQELRRLEEQESIPAYILS